MKRNLIIILLLSTIGAMGYGQKKYLANNGVISFYSHTPIEDIEATHDEVSGILDDATGEIAVIVKMTGFQFEKKLMQEHFNENYVETEKYPRSTFNGFIINNDGINYDEPGMYTANVRGDLKIHGVERGITAEGSLEVIEDGVIARTTFMLNPEDYDIKIPRLVRKNIAENLEIRVEMKLDAVL